jgi:hypothetical protein
MKTEEERQLERGGGGGAKYDCKKAGPLINHSILSAHIHASYCSQSLYLPQREKKD